MASWSAIPALSGFNYSGVTKTFSVTATSGKYFWSNGYAWGMVIVSPHKLTIEVHSGTLVVDEIHLGNGRHVSLKHGTSINEGHPVSVML
jgi:hypothetical protein